MLRGGQCLGAFRPSLLLVPLQFFTADAAIAFGIDFFDTGLPTCATARAYALAPGWPRTLSLTSRLARSSSADSRPSWTAARLSKVGLDPAFRMGLPSAARCAIRSVLKAFSFSRKILAHGETREKPDGVAARAPLDAWPRKSELL